MTEYTNEGARSEKDYCIERCLFLDEQIKKIDPKYRPPEINPEFTAGAVKEREEILGLQLSEYLHRIEANRREQRLRTWKVIGIARDLQDEVDDLTRENACLVEHLEQYEDRRSEDWKNRKDDKDSEDDTYNKK